MRRVATCLFVSTLGACALSPPPAREVLVQEALPNVAVPTRYAAPGGASGMVTTEDWIAALKEPALESLVREALVYNADLRIAAARVDAAAAYLAGAKSPLWPQVNFIGRGGGKMSGDSSGLQGGGFFASWELDLWGRVRAASRYTELQYESVGLDGQYAQQSIAALVAKGWILAIEARLSKAQALSMVRSSEDLVSLASDRLRVGVGDESEVTIARANVETMRDTVASLDLAYLNALRALETLVGRYPGATIAVAERLPAWPGEVPVGLPSELLERRPDVVAAERRVAAAFYRVEEAKAARLPRITLVANFTTISSELFVLQSRENPLLSFGAGLLQPIFLGGLLQSQVEARTAEQQAAIADYGKIGTRVFGEVEGALSAGFNSAEREAILARSVRENARALELAQVRYKVGSGDLRAVQQQQLLLYSAQVTLIRVQSERLVQRVNLHLALGGSFTVPPVAVTGDASSAK